MKNIYGYREGGCSNHVLDLFPLCTGKSELTDLSMSNFCFRSENPQHRLVVHELKGAWTSSNRDVAFALLDSFVKTQVFF